MQPPLPESSQSASSRRAFLSSSVAAGAATIGGLSLARSAHASSDNTIRLALIGCGGRGTGAATQALKACPRARLVAMADAFDDRLTASRDQIAKRYPDRVDVSAERQFVGMDAYQQAIDAGVDLVLLTTPPGFRPLHFEAAVKAGKHVFMEKPVAVDVAGIRRMTAANEQAKQQGLMVAVGLNIRHTAGNRAVIQRVHDGAIGEINFLRAYGNNAGVWVRTRQPGQTEMEYQMRNWYYFNWLCGDLIVEQTVHALDLVNWAKGDYPVEAQGTGGRQVRVGPEYGEIFDHHAVEYTYPDETKMILFCRHMRGCWNYFGGIAHGTKGIADLRGELQIHGQPPLKFERGIDGHQVEHDDMFAALERGDVYNEGDYGIGSTMTAILGRMATYSGQVVKLDEALKSDVDLGPQRYAWDAEPPIQPDASGMYACAIPGVSKPY